MIFYDTLSDIQYIQYISFIYLSKAQEYSMIYYVIINTFQAVDRRDLIGCLVTYSECFYNYSEYYWNILSSYEHIALQLNVTFDNCSLL